MSLSNTQIVVWNLVTPKGTRFVIEMASYLVLKRYKTNILERLSYQKVGKLQKPTKFKPKPTWSGMEILSIKKYSC